MSEPITVGTPAPDFTLKSDSGEDVRLSDLRGRKVVLAFYPLDWSSGCTNQMAGFTRHYGRFEEQDAAVFGISVDSVYSHKAWREALGIPFPLLADFHPKGAVAQQFGVYNEERGNARRATIVIDEDGIVRDVSVSAQGEVPTAEGVCSVLSGIR